MIKASQSGTALRTSITNMVKPTDSMAAVMEKYNISLQNSDGTQKSLMQVIEMLRNRFRGLDEATKASAAATLFGKEAMSGMLAIINAAPSDFNKLRDAIANSNGTAKEMAEIMNKTARGQITLLKSKLEGLGIQIGEKLLPHVNDLVDELGELIDWFGSLDDETQKTIIQMGLLTFAGGGTLKVIGSVSQGVGALAGGFSKLAKRSADNADKMKDLSKSAGGASKGVGLLLSSFRSLNPVTIGVTAGIAGLSAGMAVYKTHNDLMNNTILDTTDNMNALEKAVAKFTGINVKSKEELIEMGLVYKDFSDNISKEFQDRVIESTARVQEFNMKLEEMNFDGVIDEKEANDLKNRVTDMCDGVINTIKQKQEESQKSMKEFFLRDGDLHENEKTILESLDRISKTNIEEVTKLKDEILEIEQQALNNKRELSDEEVKLIQEKNNRIAQIELESLGKSHEEIVYAQTEFQNRLNNISLEDASKLMQEKAKLRDDEYNKIKDYYDTKINLLQENLTKANDTERAAFENEIKVLEGERDKKLQTNNELYDGYLNIIAEKYPYIIGEINKYNGQILQEEDHKAQERLAKLQSQYDNMNSITESGNYIMYNKTANTWDAVTITVDEKTGEIIGVYSEFAQKSGGYNKQIADSTYELSKNFNNSAINVNNALNSMSSCSVDTAGNIVDSNGRIVTSLKDVKNNADGTREGILNLNGTPINVQTDTNGAIKNLDEVKRKVNNIPEEKNVHVSVWTKIKNALGFAKGTNYAPPGVHMVGEEGTELVRQGSKVGLVGLDGPEFRRFRGGEKVIPHNRTVEMIKSINRDVITSGGYFSPNSIQSRELISNVTNNYNNNVYSNNTNISNSNPGLNADSVNQAVNLIAEALLSKINNANINLNADLNSLAGQLTPGIRNNITREQQSRNLVMGKVR
ncbi:phage tail tape measure protein [Clostridium perfringens]